MFWIGSWEVWVALLGKSGLVGHAQLTHVQQSMRAVEQQSREYVTE